MPFGALTLKPGVDVESTPTALRAGYSTSNLIRFRSGFFEKLGGWVQYFGLAIPGIPRALWAWLDLNGVSRLAIGTTTKLNVITSGVLLDITPQTKITNFAPKFTTTMGSPVVTVDDSNIANVTTLDTIEFLTPVTVDTIILSGSYPIDLVTGTTTYRITAASNGAAGVTNGGAVPTFTTTNGSSTVTVTFADHGLSVGGSVVFPIPTTVGGIVITAGTYTALSVPTTATFTISASQAASSGATVAMNSGSAELKYYIAIGPSSVTGTGWGILGWGVVPWGGTGANPSGQTGTPITTTDWTLDNWNATLMACPANSGVYAWTPGTGLQQAQLVSGAPIYNSGIFVAAPRLALVAYGSTVTKDIGVSQDPLVYKISDINDYNFWQTNVVNPTTGATSQAFESRLPTGSAIRAGLAAPNQVLLWTDLDLWAINFVGLPSIWTQTKIGANCGCVSRHALAQMAGVIYWMGPKNFYAMAGGAPTVIPCTVWDKIFQDLDTSNIDKCWVETITGFSEVWWWFPSASGGTGQCDSYVKVNVIDGSWDYGTLSRAAGIDQSILGNPIMASPQGVIYTHESSYNDNGQPLVWSIETGYFYLTEGEDFVFVDQWLPDFHYGTFNGAQTATIQVTFNVIDNMGDTPRTYGPYSMDASTNKLDIRFRGRQVSISMTANDLNTFLRLGRCRFRFAISGRR